MQMSPEQAQVLIDAMSFPVTSTTTSGPSYNGCEAEVQGVTTSEGNGVALLGQRAGYIGGQVSMFSSASSVYFEALRCAAWPRTCRRRGGGANFEVEKSLQGAKQGRAFLAFGRKRLCAQRVLQISRGCYTPRASASHLTSSTSQCTSMFTQSQPA